MKKLDVTNISYTNIVINISELLKLYDNKIFPKFIHEYVTKYRISLNDLDLYYEPMYNYIILSSLSDLLITKYKKQLNSNIERNTIFELIYKELGWDFYFFIESQFSYEDTILNIDRDDSGNSIRFKHSDIIKAMVCGETLFIAKRRSLT